MEKEEEIPKKNYTVSFNRKLSVVEKLKIIKCTEERSIHAASNYYRVSKSKVRYKIKEKVELMQVA